MARLGRFALVIASLLAVTGSLGLHPEPGEVPGVPAPAGLVSATGSASSDAGTHDCLACLAHRSVPLTRLSGVDLAPGPAVSLLQSARAAQPLPAQSGTHEGRAPPALV